MAITSPAPTPATPLPAPTKETLFSVRGLKKIFANGFEALRGIDLDIIEKQTLIIAGANGSGKTVLMQILAGLTPASEGEVFFQGESIEKSKSVLRRSVGLVFQDCDAQILGETVAEDICFGPENLKLPRSEIERRLEAALSALELGAKRDFAARSLSGGEKRRLAVAGILALGCDTIIFDEPFANMDSNGVVQILRIIKNLKAKGKTIIILTHELEKVLAFADRLIILAGGLIRTDGAPDDVLNRLAPDWGVRDPRGVYRSASDCTWLKLDAT
jgi:biotin transport system ATP-binding protein